MQNNILGKTFDNLLEVILLVLVIVHYIYIFAAL